MSVADEADWDENEHGLWCPACGNHIADRAVADREGFSPPGSCRECGFPDFENGMGYFTDD